MQHIYTLNVFLSYLLICHVYIQGHLWKGHWAVPPLMPRKWQIDCPVLLRVLCPWASSVHQNVANALCHCLWVARIFACNSCQSMHGRVSLVLGFLLVFIRSDVLSFLQLLFSAQSHVWECVLSVLHPCYFSFRFIFLLYLSFISWLFSLHSSARWILQL